MLRRENLQIDNVHNFCCDFHFGIVRGELKEITGSKYLHSMNKQGLKQPPIFAFISNRRPL